VRPAGCPRFAPRTDNRITGYCYDAAGNLLRENVCPVDMNTVTYKYDAENRMTQVDSGATATYTYDAFSRRVKKQTSAGGVEFLYDQAGRAFAEFASSTAALIRAEIYAGGMHLGTYATSPAAKTYFVHPDWLGTERVRTDILLALRSRTASGSRMARPTPPPAPAPTPPTTRSRIKITPATNATPRPASTTCGSAITTPVLAAS
jgi:YD repeat-containing protein